MGTLAFSFYHVRCIAWGSGKYVEYRVGWERSSLLKVGGEPDQIKWPIARKLVTGCMNLQLLYNECNGIDSDEHKPTHHHLSAGYEIYLPPKLANLLIIHQIYSLAPNICVSWIQLRC